MARFISLENQLRKEGHDFIAGIDEAGRGPLAGPVVCAAVILKQNTQLPGLNDSKLLSERKRKELFHQIINKAQDFSITFVSHHIIDEINILNSVRLANLLCVQHLKNTPTYVLLDGRDRQFIQIKHQSVIKGDQKIRCIAAASILAKVTRDELMKYYSRQFPRYEFHQHMGYGTRKHRQNLSKYGPSPIHRLSFHCKS